MSNPKTGRHRYSLEEILDEAPGGWNKVSKVYHGRHFFGSKTHRVRVMRIGDKWFVPRATYRPRDAMRAATYDLHFQGRAYPTAQAAMASVDDYLDAAS